ncbi:MAG: divalent-cation tolerance protein CutA [Methanomicrobiales archaeon]|nr:divalent-cation tolerance protein CutA [Methanomicrobiales archaeon]
MAFMQDTGVVVVLSTIPRHGGKAMARTLVTEHLAACVNVLETRSLFRWEGEMNDEEEDLLVIKTRSEQTPQLVQRIRALHPYELPEIIVLPVIGGHEPYLKWIGQETTG